VQTGAFQHSLTPPHISFIRPRVQVVSRQSKGRLLSTASSNEPKDLKKTISDKRRRISELEKELRQEKNRLTEVEQRFTSLTAPVARVIELPYRSLVKAIGWRLTAGVVTFSTSMYFTGGNLRIAASIVGSDFFTKSGTMYIGERLFNKVQVGRSATGENPWRSVIKALIWRLFAAVNTLIVSSILLKKASVGAKIAGVDSILKTCLMIAYDQAWSKIDWGRTLENVGGDGI